MKFKLFPEIKIYKTEKKDPRFKVFRQATIYKNQFNLLVRDNLAIKEYEIKTIVKGKSYFYYINSEDVLEGMKIKLLLTKGELICKDWDTYTSEILLIVKGWDEDNEKTKNKSEGII